MAFEEYNPTVMDHFLNPRNTGEVAKPTHHSTVTNPVCGDMMKLTLRVEDGVIRDARAKIFGCAAAIACASRLTEVLVDLPISQAEQVNDAMLVEQLGGLPEHKLKCSMVAEKALKSAIDPDVSSVDS